MMVLLEVLATAAARRWDSIITLRATLQGIALLAVCFVLALG